MKYLLTLLLIFAVSCTPDFSDARYRRPSIGHTWKRKKVPLYKNQLYRDPNVKRETRREMLKPKTINLDRW